MANEVVAAAGVDTVDEPSGADAASLEDWANQPEAVAAAAETAKPDAAKLAAGAPRGRAPAKGADALAAAAEAGKKAAAKPDPTKPAKPALPYDPAAKVKIVVDGEEEEITIDEALRRARKNSAADKRFQEASRLRQEAESLKPLEQFRGAFSDEDIANARALLKQRGQADTDPKLLRQALGEVVIMEAIEREKLEKENPAELARREAEKKLRDAEAREKAREEEAKAAEQEQARQQIRERFNKEFSQALAAHDLPATPYTVMRMAELTQENLRMGLDLPASEIAKLVQEDLSKEAAHVLKSVSLDQALKFLPKGFLDELRKYDLDKAKGSPGARPKPPPPLGPVTPRTPRGQRFTSPKAAQDALDKWAGG